MNTELGDVSGWFAFQWPGTRSRQSGPASCMYQAEIGGRVGQEKRPTRLAFGRLVSVADVGASKEGHSRAMNYVNRVCLLKGIKSSSSHLDKNESLLFFHWFYSWYRRLRWNFLSQPGSWGAGCDGAEPQGPPLVLSAVLSEQCANHASGSLSSTKRQPLLQNANRMVGAFESTRFLLNFEHPWEISGNERDEINCNQPCDDAG